MKGSDHYTVFESFHDNPFWSSFYESPHEYAFETEVTFLLQHYSEIKAHAHQPKLLVCDFSLVLDRAYADVNLSGGRLAAFDAVYEQVVRELAVPLLLVHLRCGPNEELARIRSRARIEEAALQLDYLNALNVAVERRVKDMGHEVSVLEIDSEINDFAQDSKTIARVVDLIRKALPM